MLRFTARQAILVALEDLEDIVQVEGLEVDRFLAIQVLDLELNLRSKC